MKGAGRMGELDGMRSDASVHVRTLVIVSTLKSKRSGS